MEVNIHEARTSLARLIERVQAGEEVIIVKAGRPVARINPRAVRPSWVARRAMSK